MQGFAEELAECGGLAARLVSTHTDDGSGRCVLCSGGNGGGRVVFPCSIRSLATRALHIQAEKQAGTLLPKGPGPVL